MGSTGTLVPVTRSLVKDSSTRRGDRNPQFDVAVRCLSNNRLTLYPFLGTTRPQHTSSCSRKLSRRATRRIPSARLGRSPGTLIPMSPTLSPVSSRGLFGTPVSKTPLIQVYDILLQCESDRYKSVPQVGPPPHRRSTPAPSRSFIPAIVEIEFNEDRSMSRKGLHSGNLRALTWEVAAQDIRFLQTPRSDDHSPHSPRFPKHQNHDDQVESDPGDLDALSYSFNVQPR